MGTIKGGGEYLSDPVGSYNRINEMPSGLMHLADSQSGGREGSVVLKYGSPGDPLAKSSVTKSSMYGKTPSIFGKFQKTGQR